MFSTLSKTGDNKKVGFSKVNLEDYIKQESQITTNKINLEDYVKKSPQTRTGKINLEEHIKKVPHPVGEASLREGTRTGKINLEDYVKRPSHPSSFGRVSQRGVGGERKTGTINLEDYVKRESKTKSSTIDLEDFVKRGTISDKTEVKLNRLLISKQEITIPLSEGITTKDPQKTVADVTLDAIVDSTLKQKTRSKTKTDFSHVISQIRSQTKTKETSTLVSYLAEFLRSNSKLITFTVLASTGVILAGAFALPLITGASFSLFTLLQTLSSLGLKTMPLWALPLVKGGAQIAKSTGLTYAKNYSIEKVLSMAKKSEKINNLLKMEIKPKAMVRALNNVGIDLREKDFSVENIMRQSISNGIDMSVYGPFVFLQTFVQAKMFDVVGNPLQLIKNPGEYCKDRLEAYNRTKKFMLEKLFTKNYNNINDLVDEVEKEVEVEYQKIKKDKGKEKVTIEDEEIIEDEDGIENEDVIEEVIKTSRKEKGKERIIIEEEEITHEDVGTSGSTHVPETQSESSKGPSLTETAKNMIKDNKILATATIIGITLIGTGLSRGKDDIIPLITDLSKDILGDISIDIPKTLSRNLDWLKESETAKYSMYTLLSNAIGMNKLVGLFMDKLTPVQIAELFKITEDLSKTKNPSVKTRLITKFFDVLLGEIYTKKKLETMSTYQLGIVAKKKGIKVSDGTPKNLIISAILSRQQQILNQYLGVVTNVIGNAVKTGISVAVTKKVTETVTPLAYDVVSSSINKFLATEPTVVPSAETISGVQDSLKIVEEEIKKMPIEVQEEPENLRRERLRQEAKEYIKKVRDERVVIEKEPDPELIKSMERRKTAHQRADEIRARKEAELTIKLQDELKRTGLMVPTESGGFMPAPSDEHLMDPKIREVLKDIHFTPLSDLLIRETAKSSISMIPGVGWVQGAINNINMGLSATETFKDLYKISNVLLEVTEGTSSIDIGKENIQMLDEALKFRLPNLSDAIENLVRQEPVSALHAVQRVMREVIGRGLTKEETAIEIAREFFGKIDYTDATAAEVGNKILNSLTGLVGKTF